MAEGEIPRLAPIGAPGIERREQVTAARKTAGLDQRNRITRDGDFVGVCNGDQCGQVDCILWSTRVVARQKFQRDQMADPCNRHDDSTEHLERLRMRDHFRFDSRRGEQQVRDDPLASFLGRPESDGGKALLRLVLDDCSDHVSPGAEPLHERFRLLIVIDGDRQIEVARKSGLCPHRNRQPANQGKMRPCARQVPQHVRKDAF